jgi:hypothetical protein
MRIKVKIENSAGKGRGRSKWRPGDSKWSPGGSIDQWSKDSQHFDEEQDPDPHKNEKLD